MPPSGVFSSAGVTEATQDPGLLVAEAAAAATAEALAKVATAAAPAKGIGLPDTDDGGKVTGTSTASTARFFLRGIGNLQEHHLQDYFAKFGQVVEVTLVRDKKTKRPRGMAFVELVPTEQAEEDDGKPHTLDELSDAVTSSDSHSHNGTVFEVQEALPKKGPEAEQEAEAVAIQGPGDVDPVPEAAPVQEVDPEVAARAQAQWQMHYLALAMGASVPDVPLKADYAPKRQKGKGKGGKGWYGWSPY